MIIGNTDLKGREVVSKPQIASKIKARADENAQHTKEYVSILRRSATQIFGVRWGFEIVSNPFNDNTNSTPRKIHPFREISTKDW